jgi:hypothetical protein
MKLTKVRRVLAFKQTNFLKNYIDQCTELRQKSKNDFSKSLWKLFANATFGKFIESTRNYLNVKICFDIKKAEKWVSKPNFNNIKIISKDVVLIFFKQPTATLNKAIQIGFTILERAKEFMYQTYYDIIKPNLEHCEILMSDTDSFLLAVTTREKTNNLEKIKHILDFSNYPQSHNLYSANNKNMLGFFKDELCGKQIDEYSATRSKCYAYTIKKKKNTIRKRKNKNFTIKCKGITKAGKKQVRFNNLKKCLQTIRSYSVKQYNIRSKSHCIQTMEVNKICFSSFDDKRYLICPVHSLAYNSKLIAEMKSDECSFCKIFNPLSV